jgi:hypothetical protein
VVNYHTARLEIAFTIKTSTISLATQLNTIMGTAMILATAKAATASMPSDRDSVHPLFAAF